MRHLILLTKRLVLVLSVQILLAACSNEPDQQTTTADPAALAEATAAAVKIILDEEDVTTRDPAVVAEATAAAVKLILEEDPAVTSPIITSPIITSPVVTSRTIQDDCGPPHEATLFPGFGGPNAVDLADMIVESMAIGADRNLVETNVERASNGYLLFSPAVVTDTYLINRDKEFVATHNAANTNGHTILLENGNLLRSDNMDTGQFSWGDGHGIRGCVQETSIDGSVVWQMGLISDGYAHHHDVVMLPNGNFLANIWVKVTSQEAIAAGRDPATVASNGEFLYDGIIEVNPVTRQIVWEWNTADHLVQEFDKDKANYGIVAEHPELIDINKHNPNPDGSGRDDWIHANALDYNPELGQIIISGNYLNEIWIIDHGTTREESTSHAGGRYGRGGDLLYRWGNPQIYDRGTEDDRQLFAQHNPHWIPPGLPGAGNILVFNNGQHRRRPWSTVVEITPPVNPDGSYSLAEGEAWGPTELAWIYNPEPPERFFSHYISGAQRLPNGNTLVNQGAGGRFREVTPEGEIVWEYWHDDEGGPPHAVFRANWYAPDYPGIMALKLNE